MALKFDGFPSKSNTGLSVQFKGAKLGMRDVCRVRVGLAILVGFYDTSISSLLTRMFACASIALMKRCSGDRSLGVPVKTSSKQIL